MGNESTTELSLIRGIPLEEEQGIGSLTLASYVREVASLYADREAACIYDENGEVTRWTYSDLLSNAILVARSLLVCGVSKGTRVGILATNRLEFLSGVFGTALAGGVATTLSTFSTKAELEALLQSSACSVLLLERSVLKKDFAEMVIELEPQVSSVEPGAVRSPKFPHLRYLTMIDREESVGAIEGWSAFLKRGDEISPELVEACADEVRPSDPGVLFFSSGSTGKPKGILSANRGVCLQLWRFPQWFGFRGQVRSWSANGFFWSGNFAMAIGGALSSGGTLILQRYFDAGEALTLMERERVTTVHSWPHQIAQLEQASNWNDVDLSSIYYLDATSRMLNHPTVNSDWRNPVECYGTTETFTIVSTYHSDTPAEEAVNTHGLPTAGSTIKIVDPLTGVILPRGEHGEIAVKGPTLMLGYIGVPMDQALDENGFLRTGDGGYIDDRGRLVWSGRINDIIKTGGANVSPVEIDAVITTCPGVKATQTVGVPDELLGELVVACIILHEGASLSEDQVRAFVKEQLASFKVPRRVLFFEDGNFSTTSSAKIKTDELRALAAKRLQAEAAC